MHYPQRSHPSSKHALLFRHLFRVGVGSLLFNQKFQARLARDSVLTGSVESEPNKIITSK